MKCQKCDEVSPDELQGKFCMHCGNPLPKQGPVEKKKATTDGIEPSRSDRDTIDGEDFVGAGMDPRSRSTEDGSDGSGYSPTSMVVGGSSGGGTNLVAKGDIIDGSGAIRKEQGMGQKGDIQRSDNASRGTGYSPTSIVVGGSKEGGTNLVTGQGDIVTKGGVLVKTEGGHYVGKDGILVNGDIKVSISTAPRARACPEREIFLVYIDIQNHEMEIEICKDGAIYRAEDTGDVLVQSGNEKISLNRRDQTVSRKPVQFLYEDGKMIIIDHRIGSTVRTTFLNGVAIDINKKTELNPGDIVTIGSSVTFRVEYERDRITVKQNAIIPISKEMAEKMDPRFVINKRGRFFLNGVEMQKDRTLTIGKRQMRIVLDKSGSFKDSISINREQIGGDIPMEVLSALLGKYVKDSGLQDDDTMRMFEQKLRTAQEKDQNSLKGKILERLGDSSDS